MLAIASPLSLRADVPVLFDTTDIGVTKKSTEWSIGITEGPNSIARMLGEIDHIRFAAVQEYALEADGSLSAAAKAEVDGYIGKMDQVPYPISATIMASSAEKKVHPSLLKPNGRDIDPEKWAAMFRAYIDYVENHHGRTVAMLEPMNEIDYGDKYGDKANWAEVFARFKADPVLSRYPLAGPGTLSAGAANNWYDPIKDHVDWGGTHVINGSMDALIKFHNRVTEDGKIYFANENHNLAEMIIDANYGGSGGLWWDIDTVKGEWTHIHQNARQIAYVEDRNDWTVATAYKQPNKIWLFVSGGTRAAPGGAKSTYTFTSTDRPVYFDGAGPMTEFSIEVFKDTRESIEVTWDGGDSLAPAAPGGLTATPDARSVVLDWADNAEADLAGYIVYRAEAPGGPYTELASRLTTSAYADGGLEPGRPFYYKVVAVDEPGNDSAHSAEVVGTPLAGVVHATDDFQSGGFSGGSGWSGAWTQSGGGSEEIATRNGNETAKLVGGGQVTRELAAPVNGGTLEFRRDIDNLDPGERAVIEVYDGVWHEAWSADYQQNGSDTQASADNVHNSLVWDSVGLGAYGPITRVRLRNTGDGGWDCFFVDDVSFIVRDGDATAPAVPTGLSATAQTDGTVALDWDDNGEADLGGYHVWRAETSGGPYLRVATKVSASAYSDPGAPSGTTCYYAVSAVDQAFNESGSSEEVQATVADSEAPAAPTGLAATEGRGKVALAWDDSPEPRLGGYVVYRRTVGGGDDAAIAADLPYSEFRDDDATPGAAYLYAVAVRDEAGNESPLSTEVYAEPLGPEVSDDFESAGLSGGAGWSGEWTGTGSRPLTVEVDALGNDALRIRGDDGGVGCTATRHLAAPVEGGALDFRWDIDNLDGSENAIVEVFDGEWHPVWSRGSSENGVDSVNSAGNVADGLEWSTVSLEGFRPITRIRFTNTGTGGWDVFFVDDVRFQTRGSTVPPVAGTTNLALGASVTGDSTNGANAASRAVDGNAASDGSRWVSANTAWPHWLELDLGDDYQISQLKFWTGFGGYGQAPTDFRFQYWADGQWHDVFAETGNQDPTYSRYFAPVTASRVRLYATAGSDNYFRLYEIEVYGVPAPAVPVDPPVLSITVEGETVELGFDSVPGQLYQLQRFDANDDTWNPDGDPIDTSGQSEEMPRSIERARERGPVLYRLSYEPADGG